MLVKARPAAAAAGQWSTDFKKKLLLDIALRIEKKPGGLLLKTAKIS